MIISVIIPVYNGLKTLPHCLAALQSSSRCPDELIIIDDGSTDGSGNYAESLGHTVVKVVDGPAGPAAARNLAAIQAQGNVLVFVDADVAVHPDAIARIAAHLTADPQLDALFGSYDDSPPMAGLISRYKNLLHHYVHQNSAGEVSSFWAGCGAVRAQAFRAIGGFDAEAYPVPSIEDIDLGVRLRKAGHRIRCCPDVQSAHWKQWGLLNWLRTDIFCRAIPWTQLILREGPVPNSLNLNRRAQIAALASLGAVGSAALAIFYPVALILTALALAVVLACNAGLVQLLFRRGGPLLATAGFGFHVVYFLYSSLTFAGVVGAHRLRQSINLRTLIGPQTKLAN